MRVEGTEELDLWAEFGSFFSESQDPEVRLKRILQKEKKNLNPNGEGCCFYAEKSAVICDLFVATIKAAADGNYRIKADFWSETFVVWIERISEPDVEELKSTYLPKIRAAAEHCYPFIGR